MDVPWCIPLADCKDVTVRIVCVLADEFSATHIEPGQLKDIGALWGSWRTWRAWQTDNVLCHDFFKADELIKRAFHAVCNLYIPNKNYGALNRPPKVNLYDGDFPGEFDHPEEIVSMHLVADSADLVLLFGYDVSKITETDKFQKHKKTNYLNAFRATLNTYPQTQFVLIDHANELDTSLTKIPNLTCDKFEAVLQLLN